MRIETERLILRPVVESDAAAIFEYARNEHVGRSAGWKPHESMEETREIMKLVFLDKENVFGMELKETGKLIGSIGIAPDPKRQNDKARMLGYAVGVEPWGRGYTTEAALVLIRYGFEALHLDLISAYCYPFNARSKRVIEKCGFEYEGRLRLAEKRYDGEILDCDCYSIIRKDSREAYLRPRIFRATPARFENKTNCHSEPFRRRMRQRKCFKNKLDSSLRSE